MTDEGHDEVRFKLNGELDDVVRVVCAETGVTGIAVGVTADGNRMFSTAGTAHAGSGRPVSPGTLFQVGSISKTFTSACLMTLVGQGLVALEDSAARHLPELAAELPELCLYETTIEQLLSHTSGFDGDHLLVRREGRDLKALRGARRLFDPGQGWSYSNAAFTLVGAIVEAVTQLPFRSAVRHNVLEPLGLGGAAYRADDVVLADVAAPHWVYDGISYVIQGAGWQPGWELEPLDHAPGGLIASAEHLLTWCEFQLDGRDVNGAPLLTGDQLARLHTPVAEARRGVGIALDWFVTDVDGATLIGHGGATAGYLSDLTVVPGAGLGLVVLTNATNGGVAIRKIRRWILERFAGLVETDPVVVADAAPPIGHVTGRYLHPFGILTVSEADPSASVSSAASASASASAPAGMITITTVPRDDVTWQPPPDPAITCGFVTENTIVGVSGKTRPIGTFGPFKGGHARWLNWHERRALRID